MKKYLILLSGLFGSFLLLFVSWEWNTVVAPWLAFPLLLFFFRNNKNKFQSILIILLIILVKYLTIIGGWDIDSYLNIIISIVFSAPLIVALLIDKHTHQKFNAIVGSLIFPIFYTTFDYLLGLPYLKIGTGFTLAITQFNSLSFIQLSSILGIWSVSFLIPWFASTINHAIEVQFNLRKTKYTLNLFLIVFIAIIAFGSFKVMFTQSPAETVKIAGITVEHPIDFWKISDNMTIKSEKSNYVTDINNVNDELFEKSQSAADFGAKIIFWSEANGISYEDDYDSLIARGQQFAIDNDVYLMMALLVYEYDSYKNDNIVVSISPNGEVIDIYEKTISWLPTDSDGLISTFDTEYGVIGTAICFDMDFPHLIKQSVQKNVDILIVPAFDTKKIGLYHTEVGLMRSVDFGINVFRQVNHGTSMAVDYNGTLIGYQNYYNTDNRILIVDMPINHIFTFYRVIGDVFVYLNIAATLALAGSIIYKRKSK